MEANKQWLESDSIFLPVGSEAAPGASASTTQAVQPTSTASSGAAGEAKERDDEEEQAPEYHLPRLNEAINDVLKKYPQVFPKLNLTAPRDASFLLQSASGPLTSQRASDVYLFLKSSNLIHHDLEPERLYEGCEDADIPPTPSSDDKGKAKDSGVPLELVLRKYISGLNPAMEFRCFVRDGVLVGISQRDFNFYDHLQNQETQEKLRRDIREFFEDELASNPPVSAGSSNATTAAPDNASYVFDVYVDSKGTLGYGYKVEGGDKVVLLDFQPYRASTDGLQFSYEDIRDILERSRSGAEDAEQLPVLRVIDSAGHPDAIRNQPTFSTNMMPVEMIELSEGRNLDEFREVWAQAVAAGMVDPADLPVGGALGASGSGQQEQQEERS